MDQKKINKILKEEHQKLLKESRKWFDLVNSLNMDDLAKYLDYSKITRDAQKLGANPALKAFGPYEKGVEKALKTAEETSMPTKYGPLGGDPKNVGIYPKVEINPTTGQPTGVYKTIAADDAVKPPETALTVKPETAAASSIYNRDYKAMLDQGEMDWMLATKKYPELLDVGVLEDTVAKFPSRFEGLELLHLEDALLPDKLRSISVLPVRNFSDDMLSAFYRLEMGTDMPKTLDPRRKTLLKMSYKKTAKNWAADLERQKSIKSTEALGGRHGSQLDSFRNKAGDDVVKGILRRGGEQGVITNEYADIGANIDRILTTRNPTHQKYEFLEPTRVELQTGVPRWEGLEATYKNSLEVHADVGGHRMKSMATRERPHPELSPRWFNHVIMGDILRSLEFTNMPKRSLTTDEIVDLARTNLYATNLEGYKVAVDVYRWLEARGQLPYQQIKRRSVLEPGYFRNKDIIDENKINNIILEELVMLMKETI